MQIDNVEIKIAGNAALIGLPGTDGSRMYKTISLKSLIKAFQENANGVETPMLPLGCIKYKERGNTAIISMYHEPATFTAKFSGELLRNEHRELKGDDGYYTFENVKRGGIVFTYFFNKSSNGSFSLSDTRCHGVKAHPLTFNDNTELFMLPFPNVGKDNGWVCWGDHRVGGTVNSLCGYRSYVNVFFATVFNNDLFDTRALRNYGIEHPIDLFLELQKRETFPDEFLINPMHPLTIGGF